MLKRIGSFFVAVIFTSFIFLSTLAVTADGSYKNWLQSDSRWGSKTLGGSGETMAEIGCAVTSLATLVVHSGSRSESDFNPGVLVDYLNSSGGLDSQGNLYWGAVSGLVSSFTFEKRAYISYKSQSSITQELTSYINQGYYIILSVQYDGHWVAIDTIKNGVVYMMDPAQNGTNKLFDYYNVNGMLQVRLYKGKNKPPQVGGVEPHNYLTGNYKTTSALNLRASYSTSSDILVTIPQGKTVSVTQIYDDQWGKTEYEGKTGWIYLEYTEYVGAPTTTASTTKITTTTPITYKTGIYKCNSDSGVNMRSGAGTDKSVVCVIPYNADVTVSSVSGEWGKATYGSYSGYVCMEYLKYVGPASSTTTITTPKITTNTSIKTTLKTTVKTTTTRKTTITDTYKTGIYKCNCDSDSYVNMRSGAGTDKSIVCTIPYGAEVTISSVSGEWGKATYGSYSGYVYMEFMKYVSPIVTTSSTPKTTLKTTPKTTVQTTTTIKTTITDTQKTGIYKCNCDPDSYVNMRSGAGTDKSIVCTIPYGAEVTISAISGEWGKATYGSYSGYVYMEFMKYDKPIVTTSSTPKTTLKTTQKTTVQTTATTINTTVTSAYKTGIYKCNSESGLIMRNNIGIANPVVCIIPYNAQVIISDVSENWGKAVYDSYSGFVCLDYLSFVSDTPVSSATTAATTVPPITSTVSSSYVKGDINRDGKINKEDVLTLNIYINNPYKLDSIQNYIFDVNNDGEVNEIDVICLMKKIKNLENMKRNELD